MCDFLILLLVNTVQREVGCGVRHRLKPRSGVRIALFYHLDWRGSYILTGVCDDGGGVHFAGM